MNVELDDFTPGFELHFDFGLPGARGPAGIGDVSSDTSVSIDSEIAIFSGDTGKMIKRATNTGLLKSVSGVIANATVDADYLSPSSSIDCGVFT